MLAREVSYVLLLTSVLHSLEALVFFEQNFTSFSEADGEQDIYLQMTGGPLSVNTSVTVYNLNTNEEIAEVAFMPNLNNQRVSFSLSNPDNNVALQPDRIFRVGIRESPSVTIGNPSEMTIVVIDDDEVTVSFNNSFYEFSEDDGQSSGIVLVLSNPIAQDLSVTVFGAPGQQPSTIEASGFTINQSVVFTAHSNYSHMLPNFTIVNDEVALETVEAYNITLVSASPSKNVILGRDSLIMITDEDVVKIMFNNETYNFTEGESGQIEVRISLTVAQDVRVTVNGGPIVKPHVFLSGPNVNQEVLFRAHGNRITNFPIEISDDDIALENLESFIIAFIVVSPSNQSIIAEDTATINIASEDIVNVSFTSSDDLFEETISSVDIGVTIDIPIARDLVVYLFGESQASAGVALSGCQVNTSVTFTALSGMLMPFFIDIKDDDVALEKNEEFEIEFIQTSSADGFMFGPSTKIIITDDDKVTASFNEIMYSFSEGVGQSSGIAVNLTNQIAQELQISIYADPGQQPNTVEVSGFISNATITFLPFSSTSQILPGSTITNDDIALETVESYNISLVSSNPNIDLGPAAIIQITDDDVPYIGFVQNYTFTEGDTTAAVQLNINGVIYQDITISLEGESSTQDGVVNSGISIDFNITFTANGNLTILQHLEFRNDDIGRENDEQYEIQLTSSTHPADITTSGTTTITITDDDATSITFAHHSYNFSESVGLSQQVAVVMNREVAQNFTIRVFGGTIPLAPYVVDSGSSVDELVTFLAYNSSESNLQQIVEVQIKNDNVSGEPIQQYTLALLGQPNDVSLSPFSNTTIYIHDDDESDVRFAKFVGPLFESSETYDLIVLLNREVSSPASVDVLDADGNTVGTAVFQPIQGQSTQQKTVTVNFTDDNTALEDSEILRFSLSNPISTTLFEPSTVDIVITDDDNVTITFVSSSYNYTEDHGEVSDIKVQLSNAIAKSLTVLIAGGLLGSSNSSSVTFPAGTSASSPIPISPFSIENDMIGLEEDEMYQLMFIDVLNDTSNVILGQPTTVIIFDEDVVAVSIGNAQYSYPEGSGSHLIPIEMNRPVARGFTIRVFGVRFPLAPGVVDSGSDVNETVTFGPQSNLTQHVSLNITDDDVSNEPDQEYGLTLSQAPQDVALSPHSNTTIIIQDNDLAYVQFVPFTGQLLESAEEFNLTVLLDGEISLPVSVTILNSTGIPVQEVIFDPIQDQTSQEATVTIAIDDDDVALEENEILYFSLSDPQGVTLSKPSSINVSIEDDDVIAVMFTNSTYSFIEGQSGHIGVEVSNIIACNLSVLIKAVPGIQPYVVNSGSVINQQITFTTSGSRLIYLPVKIINDDVAFEVIESYNVSISNKFSVQNVVVGDPAKIEIYDDDNVHVMFAAAEYNFGEADGTGVITVQIDKSIVFDLIVFTFGESMPTPAVAISGGPVNSSVTFLARGSLTAQINITIIDDLFELEKVEEYEVHFTTSTPSVAVLLGTNTKITITDDDIVSVNFDQGFYVFNESDEVVFVTVSLSRAVSHNISVNIVGGPIDSSIITVSGPQTNETVFFTAGGSTNYTLVLKIQDDQNALEDDESFTLCLENPNPANIDSSSKTTVKILDDDAVTVNFSNLTYTFDENEPDPQISVHINRLIHQDLEVSVFGESLPASGVVISGNPVNKTITFLAQGIMMAFITLNITNDEIVRENVEIFSLKFEGSSPSDKVILGPNATVRIIDDDVTKKQSATLLQPVIIGTVTVLMLLCMVTLIVLIIISYRLFLYKKRLSAGEDGVVGGDSMELKQNIGHVIKPDTDVVENTTAVNDEGQICEESIESAIKDVQSTTAVNDEGQICEGSIESAIKDAQSTTAVNDEGQICEGSMESAIKDVQSTTAVNDEGQICEGSIESAIKDVQSDTAVNDERQICEGSIESAIKDVQSDTAVNDERQICEGSIESAIKDVQSDTAVNDERQICEGSIESAIKDVQSDTAVNDERQISEESIESAIKDVKSTTAVNDAIQ